MTLGAKIRQLRQSREWSQGDLNHKAGLGKNGRGYISNLENGRVKQPGAMYIVKLAGAFGVSEDILFEAAGMKCPSPQTLEEERLAIQDQELYLWLSSIPLNTLSAVTRRAVAALIQAELGGIHGEGCNCRGRNLPGE